MDRKDFDRLLAQGSLPSVLLFEGEEEQMKQAREASGSLAPVTEDIDRLLESIALFP